MRCITCHDHGWLLVDNSDHGLRIEKCDRCERFSSNEKANRHVASIASSIPPGKHHLVIDHSLYVGLSGLALAEHKTIDELVTYTLRRIVQLTR